MARKAPAVKPTVKTATPSRPSNGTSRTSGGAPSGGGDSAEISQLRVVNEDLSTQLTEMKSSLESLEKVKINCFVRLNTFLNIGNLYQ